MNGFELQAREKKARTTVQEGESLQELREALSSTGIEAPR